MTADREAPKNIERHGGAAVFHAFVVGVVPFLPS